MEILTLTIPNIIGYVVIGVLLVKALAHRSAARELKGHLHASTKRLDETLPKPPKDGPVTRRAVERKWSLLKATAARSAQDHPTADVLTKFTDDPGLAEDDLALDAWMVGALDEHVGPLRNASELNAGTAAPCGLIFTVLGFCLATSTLSSGQDTSAFLGATAMALLTTFGSSIVVLLERRLVKGTLEPLESRCALHAQEWIARARSLYRWQKAGARCGTRLLARTPPQTAKPARRTS